MGLSVVLVLQQEERRSSAQREAIDRVRSKLTGKDFEPLNETLAVPQQVDRLILEATSHENLSKLFKGWCAFW
jgi:FKBP12-rapamycin complex-associated protein